MNHRKKRNTKWITKILICIIIILICLIYTNLSQTNLNNFKENILNKNIKFSFFNNIYKKYIGNLDSNNNNSKEQLVFNDDVKINYEKINNYYKINNNLEEPIRFISSGIIVFNANMESLGNTIIVQGNDGYDIWYSNVSLEYNSLYDYVKKGDIIGNSKDDSYYITIMKDGQYIDYEEYQQNNKN